MKSISRGVVNKLNIDDFCFEIHVTEMCNYSCSYCNLSPMNKHETIDYSNMFKLDLPKNTRVFLLGGEPTLDRYFFDIINECYYRGYTNISVQTNLTFNVEKMTSLLIENNTPVKFYCSFHMQHADLKTFIKKCVMLHDNELYGGIHLMWLNDLNDKCLLYYNIMKKTLGNVSLEPTLPKSLFPVDWNDKFELKKFIEYGHVEKCDRLKKILFIDDVKTTIAHALADNIEREIYHKKCNAPKNTVVYSVNKNKFYYCTFDLLYDRDFDIDQFNSGYCLCKNKICCADLEFSEKCSHTIK